MKRIGYSQPEIPDSVEHLVFLYNIICYTISFAAYILAVFTALIRKRAEEWAYVLFMTSFLFFFVPSMIFNYFDVAGVNENPTVDRIFSLSVIIGLGLMIYALPRFVHAFTHFRKAKTANAVFLSGAILASAISIVLLGGAAEDSSHAPLFITLAVTIVYSIVTGHIYGRVAGEDGETTAGEPRWTRIMRAITILTICLIPFSLLIDMFPGLWPGHEREFPLQTL